MKKLLLSLLLMSGVGLAHADYRFIVPQEPGAGTSVWTGIVAHELEKKLGEKIIIQHIPGARDIPGPNKFQEELRFDAKTVMVAHGGNAESYLVDDIKYNYRDWEPIGAMNITIETVRRTDVDVFQNLKFAAGSGNNPDLMAMTLLICGPQPDLQAYAKCYQEHNVKFVPGMNAGERRLALERGELTAMRETPSAYLKFFTTIPNVGPWFNEGVLNIKSGRVEPDVNFPRAQFFEEVYRAKWGQAPKGELYEAYMLVKNWRDVLQKSLWVNKGNPNADRLRQALKAMLADPESMAIIEKENGRYDFLVGSDVTAAMGHLEKLTTHVTLKNLVWWDVNVYKQNAIYKEHLPGVTK
jgi:hypothetical protein